MKQSTHRRMRFIGLLLAITALLEAACLFVMRRGLGFPDGHLTELARVQKTFYPILASLLVVYAVAALAARGRKRVLLVAFVLLNAAWLLLEIYFRSICENGTGG